MPDWPNATHTARPYRLGIQYLIVFHHLALASVLVSEANTPVFSIYTKSTRF